MINSKEKWPSLRSLGNSKSTALPKSLPSSPVHSVASGTTAAGSPHPKCSSCHIREVGLHPTSSERPAPEKDLQRPLHGWPELAKLMADHSELVAFPAFRELNIKSLLYYQCQLSKLRMELHELEWDDHRNGQFLFAGELSQNFETLLQCKDNEDPQACEQIDKIEEIRTVLKDYNAALIQYAQVKALPEPDSYNVDCLRSWLVDPKLGDAEIKGAGRSSWGDLTYEDKVHKDLKWHLMRLVKSPFVAAKPAQVCPDLITPHTHEKIDGLTRWVASDWVPFWEFLCDRFSGRNPQQPRADIETLTKEKSVEASHEQQNEPGPTLTTYSMKKMLKFTSLLATLIACLLPIVAITVLSTVHTTAKILGCMTVFTTMFASGLMCLTPPGTSRTEIFTATAAFSAVLVVFVQNQNKSTVVASVP